MRKRAPGAWVVWVLLILAVTWVTNGHDDRAARAEVDATGASPALPAQGRAAYVEERQAEGARDPAYAMRPDDEGELSADDPRTRTHTRIDAGGVAMDRPGEPWTMALGAVRYGCAGALSEVDRGPARAQGSPNRAVAPVRAGMSTMDEWYVHGPLGVEHGFTLPESPCADPGDGAIVIEVGVRGLRATARRDGDGVDLRDSRGVTRAHYTDLWARAADGAPLPATMAVSDGRIALRVDAGGARFPVVVDPLAWFEEQKLVAADGAPYAELGAAVALDGNTVVVGAAGATIGANQDQGAVYVYVGSGGEWSLQQKLTASDGAANDVFGSSVAISGDTIVVGANNATVAGAAGEGAAYAFVRSNGQWTEQQKLVAGDGGAGWGFGWSLAMSGGTLLVGADTANQLGAAYVFKASGGTWTQQQKLVGDAYAGSFGWSVALSGSTALVGADGEASTNNASQGAGYVFVESAGTWTQQGMLVASDGAAFDMLGYSAALSGDIAVLGAWGAVVDGRQWQGAAYVFARSAGTWTQEQKLEPDGATAEMLFGSSVGVSGATVVVSAPIVPVGTSAQQGVGYVFTGFGGIWTQQQALAASDGGPGDYFGQALAMSASTVVFGAPGATVANQGQQGAAFVFAFLPTNSSACTASSQCGSGHCIDGVCCDQACTGQCEACDVPGSVGVCTPVTTGAPHGARPACSGTGTACAGECSASTTAACEYPVVGTACGARCSADVETDSTCDGAGACVAGSPAICPGGFGCSGTTRCAAACETSSECKPGFACTGGSCVPQVATACVDDHTSQSTAGALEDCGAYLCDVASGICDTSCTSVADCAAPNVCSQNGACIDPTASGLGASAGCALASGGRERPFGLLVLGLLGLAVARAGRRRRQNA